MELTQDRVQWLVLSLGNWNELDRTVEKITWVTGKWGTRIEDTEKEGKK
jgi:hypothetical protein